MKIDNVGKNNTRVESDMTRNSKKNIIIRTFILLGLISLLPLEEKTESNLVSEEYSDCLDIYNKLLEGSEVQLSEDDLRILASLADKKIIGIESTEGFYDTVCLDQSSGVYVCHDENGKVRVKQEEEYGTYTYDLLRSIYASDGLSESEKNSLVLIDDYISANDLEICGYYVPEIFPVVPSEDAIEYIKTIYGEDLANAVEELGLPIPYYKAGEFDKSLQREKKF